MRTAIGKYYNSYDEKQRGLTVGLVFGRGIEWREILFVKKPHRYLSFSIEVTRRRTVEHAVFGPVEIPTIGRCELRGIDSGIFLCLSDVYQERGARSPYFSLFSTKDRIASADRGWAVRHKTDFAYEETPVWSRTWKESDTSERKVPDGRFTSYALQFFPTLLSTLILHACSFFYAYGAFQTTLFRVAHMDL